MKWFDWAFESIAALIKNKQKQLTQICFLIQFRWMEYENTDLNLKTILMKFAAAPVICVLFYVKR